MNNDTGAFGWKIKKIVSKGDYNYAVAVVPEHPYDTELGNYVLEHRIIMENHLGRILYPNEVVHHINENKKDNRIENLQLETVNSHPRKHGLKKGQKWVDLKCPSCKTLFDRPYNHTHLAKPSSFTSCSSECRGKFSYMMKAFRETSEVKKALSENVVKIYHKYILDDSEEYA